MNQITIGDFIWRKTKSSVQIPTDSRLPHAPDTPRWTVFYDEGLGNPFGFLKPDEKTGEGCLMEF